MFYNNDALWSTIPAAACKAQLRQLGGKAKQWICPPPSHSPRLPSLSLSLVSVSLVEINCSFYIRKQPHSWSAVTVWLIPRAVRFIIIVINYHLVPRWPFLFGVPSVDFHAVMGGKVIWECDWSLRYPFSFFFFFSLSFLSVILWIIMWVVPFI